MSVTARPDPFRPENELERALVAAYETNQLEPLLRALAFSDVYLPAPEPGPDEERHVTAHEGDEIPLPIVEADDGPFVPVFSSLTQLGRVRPEGGGYLKLQGRALAAIWPAGHRLALNPGGDLGLPLAPEDVARLRDAPPPGDEGFLIGEPREEPVELLDAIRRFAARRPEVRAAYRGLIVRRPGTGAAPDPLVGLELDPDADVEAVMEAAAEAARGAGVPTLALVPLDPHGDGGPAARFLLTRTTPFYVRDRERP